MAEGTAAGGPRSAADMINAATAAANSCIVVTADYRDFRRRRLLLQPADVSRLMQRRRICETAKANIHAHRRPFDLASGSNRDRRGAPDLHLAQRSNRQPIRARRRIPAGQVQSDYGSGALYRLAVL
jgi:hypothetical protein